MTIRSKIHLLELTNSFLAFLLKRCHLLLTVVLDFLHLFLSLPIHDFPCPVQLFFEGLHLSLSLLLQLQQFYTLDFLQLLKPFLMLRHHIFELPLSLLLMRACLLHPFCVKSLLFLLIVKHFLLSLILCTFLCIFLLCRMRLQKRELFLQLQIQKKCSG